MAIIKKFLSGAIGVALLTFGGMAQAATITYEFEAKIDSVVGTVGTLAEGDVVSGTFSFDDSSFVGNYYGVEVYLTGDIDTGVHSDPVSGGGSGDKTYVLDVSDASAADYLFLQDYDAGVHQTIAIKIESADGEIGSTSLGDALLSGQYTVEVYGPGEYGKATGTIGSFTKVSTSVPELSAGGSATSVALLAGAAFVLTSRRRQDEIR